MSKRAKTIRRKSKKINPFKGITTFFYDFDGVMTDNKVRIYPDGTESVVCSRADGWGIAGFKNLGFHQCIITTETNPIVLVRAKKLKLPCLAGCDDKKETILEYAKENNIDLRKCAYVGNDTNDLSAMKLVALKIAPADASKEILSIANIITKKKGGDGVIREIYATFLES